MACQSSADIARLRAEVEKLRSAVRNPVASATYDGRGSVSYRAYDDLKKMLDQAEAELNAAVQVTGPVRKIVFWAGRGM